MICAHSANSLGQRHDLVTLLRVVASLASQFSEDLGARSAAYWLGLWHDLGKFHPAFQRYLLESEADPKKKGHGPDRDCGDFPTWAEAQGFFEAAGGRSTHRHRLDSDGDGVACESLPGAP
jgi:hypothetical protein